MSKYKSLVRVIKEHNTPVDLNEVQDKEINAVKKLSKDMEKIKKDYFKIAKMGDKTLQLTGFNKQYESILKAQQEILKIIGDMETMKILSDKSKKEEVELEEKLGYNGNYQRKSKYDGKEFDAKKELQTLKKFGKALEQADKIHSDLQYPNVVDTVTHMWDHLNNAWIGTLKYQDQIKNGEYDGIVDNDS